MTDIACRLANRIDLDQCIQFQTQTNEDYWELNDFVKILNSDLGILVVAEDQAFGSVVGYCTGFLVPTKQNEGALHETRVDINRRKEGIGTLLVEYFCQYLFNRGVDTIYASISDEHRVFYLEKCGFTVSNQQWIEISRTVKK